MPFLLALIYALAFIDRALMAAAGGPIKAELALSDAQFGLLGGTAFALLFCLASIPLGWLADRIDRRRLIAGGVLFWSAMTALSGLTEGFAGFGLARLGVGLGEACLIPAGVSLLRDHVTPERRGRAIALFLMGATSGNAIALLGGGWLLSIGAPWRSLFLGAAAMGLPLAAAICLVQEPARSEPTAPATTALRHLWERRRAYAYLTAATACVIGLAQSQALWIPQLFSRRFGLPPGKASLLAGAMFALSAPVGQWLGGTAIDRLRHHGVQAPSHAALVACCAACLPAALLFTGIERLEPSLAAYFLFSLAVFAATPSGMSGWQAMTPPHGQGMVIAILTSVATLVGIGVGPVTVGWLSDRWSLGAALMTLSGVAACFGGLFALAGWAPFAEAVQRS